MATNKRTYKELFKDLRTELANDIEFYEEARKRATTEKDKIRWNAKLEQCEQIYDYTAWLLNRKDKTPWEE